MPRVHLTTALAVAASSLAVLPTSIASAGRPSAERYLNDSSANGVLVKTTPRTIKSLHFYCSNPEDAPDPDRFEYRELRYDIRDYVRVHRDGSFSYRGRANRYGAEGQWMDHRKVSLKGRFTSPTHVRIKRTLSGCDTATVAADAQR